jgi:hypothetical protein
MKPLTLPPNEHINDDDGVGTKDAALPAHAGILYRKSEPAPPSHASDRHTEASAELTPEQRRAKRKEALEKMRDLWNNSQARTNRLEGEDGVAFQKRMRAEW